jgi:hypothetical protein
MADTRRVDTGAVRGVGRTSGVIVLAGGVLIALAYWVLPVATVPLVGSVSAPALVDEVSGASFGLLRVVPLTALLTVAAGVWLLARPTGRGRRVAQLLALGCAVLTALAYLVPLGRVDQALDSAGADSLGIEATNLTGTGFWLALIGSVVAAVGAAVPLATARARGRKAASA